MIEMKDWVKLQQTEFIVKLMTIPKIINVQGLVWHENMSIMIIITFIQYGNQVHAKVLNGGH